MRDSVKSRNWKFVAYIVSLKRRPVERVGFFVIV